MAHSKAPDDSSQIGGSLKLYPRCVNSTFPLAFVLAIQGPLLLLPLFLGELLDGGCLTLLAAFELAVGLFLLFPLLGLLLLLLCGTAAP